MQATDLRQLVRVYDGNLDGALCAQLIESFDALKRFHQANGRGHKQALDQSAWTELNVTRFSDPAFLAYFRMRIDDGLERYNRELQLPVKIPLSPKMADLILKRYRPATDESFQLHFDAVHEVANRYLVFLWYLNDVASGGETEFPALGLKVEPRAGRLLMFPPYWMYAHAGLTPISNDKYILSTYLLF